MSTIFEPFAAPFRVSAQDAPYCECAPAWGFECYPGTCSSPTTCRGWMGCGPNGTWDCEAVCSY